MKRKFLVVLTAILVLTMVSCAAFKPTVKKEVISEPIAPAEVVAKAESAAAMDEGVFIKIDKKDQSQKALVEAVRVLEKLNGIPLVLISGGLVTTRDGTKASVVRYTLYFEVSESMYTVVSISNGMITEIMPVNRSGRVLVTRKISVKKILEASGINKSEPEQESD